MPSVNLSKKILQEVEEEDPDQATELDWNKSEESFSEYFERLHEKAREKSDKIEVGETALEEIEDRMEDRMRGLFREFSR